MKTDPVVRSDRLDKKIAAEPDLNQSVAALLTASERNRRLIRINFVALIFELILSAAVGFVFVQTTVNNASVKANHNAILAGCSSNNEFRKSNLVLWQYILAIPPRMPLTPEQQKTTADFTKFLNKTFAPRDCSHIK